VPSQTGQPITTTTINTKTNLRRCCLISQMNQTAGDDCGASANNRQIESSIKSIFVIEFYRCSIVFTHYTAPPPISNKIKHTTPDAGNLK
jgi:hypothetical protein